MRNIFSTLIKTILKRRMLKQRYKKVITRNRQMFTGGWYNIIRIENEGIIYKLCDKYAIQHLNYLRMKKGQKVIFRFPNFLFSKNVDDELSSKSAVATLAIIHEGNSYRIHDLSNSCLYITYIYSRTLHYRL